MGMRLQESPEHLEHEIHWTNEGKRTASKTFSSEFSPSTSVQNELLVGFDALLVSQIQAFKARNSGDKQRIVDPTIYQPSYDLLKTCSELAIANKFLKMYQRITEDGSFHLIVDNDQNSKRFEVELTAETAEIYLVTTSKVVELSGEKAIASGLSWLLSSD